MFRSEQATMSVFTAAGVSFLLLFLAWPPLRHLPLSFSFYTFHVGHWLVVGGKLRMLLGLLGLSCGAVVVAVCWVKILVVNSTVEVTWCRVITSPRHHLAHTHTHAQRSTHYMQPP